MAIFNVLTTELGVESRKMDNNTGTNRTVLMLLELEYHSMDCNNMDIEWNGISRF